VAGDLRLQHVYSGGPAERAGLAPGDVLVALDGIKASAHDLDALFERRAAGVRVAAHAFRRDQLMTFDVELATAPLDTACVTPDPDAAPDALARRVAWLGTPVATA
jgi:predicted metalloprotease with PDZ domain